jgi:hypothetical protein
MEDESGEADVRRRRRLLGQRRRIVLDGSDAKGVEKLNRLAVRLGKNCCCCLRRRLKADRLKRRERFWKLRQSRTLVFVEVVEVARHVVLDHIGDEDWPVFERLLFDAACR